jgi:hypothetical protein
MGYKVSNDEVLMDDVGKAIVAFSKTFTWRETTRNFSQDTSSDPRLVPEILRMRSNLVSANNVWRL